MEKLVSEIVSVEIDIRDEGTEWESEYRRGYRVYSNHPLAEIKFIDTPDDAHLFLGSYEVINYGYHANDFHYKIPVWYCVRTFVDDYPRFVCGLDLMSDGRVWVGIGKDSYFDSVDEAMNFVQKHEGKECVIFTEEKMML